MEARLGEVFMNKKGLLILVMAVLWFWGINRKPLSVRAATDWGEQFITNVELRNSKDQADRKSVV